MSHRALVAVRQGNGAFNVHYSHNGAEKIQLLDELRDTLNVHGQIDWEELTGSTMPDLGQRMMAEESSGYTIDSADTENIVEPTPSATDVPAKGLLAGDDLLEFEVLYVVDDGNVDAYWLAWTYPDVIRPWSNHLSVEVYRSGRHNSPGEAYEYIEESEPIRTISEFEHGWLDDSVVTEIARDHHRWIYEQVSMTAREVAPDEYDVDAEGVRRIVQTPNYWLSIRTSLTESPVPTGLPYVLPIEIGTPPNLSSGQIEDAAAGSRYQIGAGLNAVSDVDSDDIADAFADVTMEILDEYADRVATEFLPPRIAAIVEAYREHEQQIDLADVLSNNGQ